MVMKAVGWHRSVHASDSHFGFKSLIIRFRIYLVFALLAVFPMVSLWFFSRDCCSHSKSMEVRNPGARNPEANSPEVSAARYDSDGEDSTSRATSRGILPSRCCPGEDTARTCEIIGATTLLREDCTQASGIDPLGTLFLPLFSLSAAFLLDNILSQREWNSLSTISLFTAISSFVLFAWIEGRVARYPIIPLKIILSRQIGILLLSRFFLMMSISSVRQEFLTKNKEKPKLTLVEVLYLLPLELAIANIGTQTNHVGTVLTADYLGSPVGSMLGGAYVSKTGRTKDCIIVGSLGIAGFYCIHAFSWNG